MNEAQRKVLRSHHGDILKNLILDTDILGALLQKDILSETMVQHIQSKSTQHEKIIELLFMLPKRGPRAFPLFLEAVRKHSSFLADKLEVAYEKEQKEQQNQQLTDPLSTSDEPSHESSNVSTAHSPKAKPHKQLPPNPPEKKLLYIAKTDSHIHAQPPSTQQQPSEVQQPSEQPKQSSQQPHHQPGQQSGTHPVGDRIHSAVGSVSNHVITTHVVQHNLNGLYTKLRAHRDSKQPTREPSFSTPEPATFKMVDKLVDELIQMLEEYEMMFSQCHALLGGKDRNYPLVSHIINLQKAKREMEHDLKTKEQQKNKYADYISKLENRCRNQSTEITHLNDEMRKLKEENEKLQEINSEREEKQKIIDDLRKMVMDADTTKKSKLRSSYLALHYDGTASEIKQLKVEVRNLKMENQNLKTENVMLKKAENLKKLVKLRVENSTASKPDATQDGKGVSVNSTESEESRQTEQKPRQMFVGSVSSYRGNQINSLTTRQIDTDRSTGQLSDRSQMKGSIEQLDQVHHNSQPRPAKEPLDLDFKFANSQNGVSLGQKRSSSKERSNKRVTFLHEEYNNVMYGKGNVVKVPMAESEDVNGEAESNGSKTKAQQMGNGAAASSKPGIMSKNRQTRQPGRAKGSSKRSASLNSLPNTRDIMKMSTQLIQKSRNMRH